MLWSLLIISLIGSALSDDDTPNCITQDMPTSQSSDYTDKTYKAYSADRAIDGNNESCAHTSDQSNSWWTIDLLGIYKISSVSIYNKDQHNTNVTGARIHIGNSLQNNGINNEVCENIRNFQKGTWNNITCKKKLSGRFITVFSPEKKCLILCEVEIFGKRQESPFKLLKTNKTWEDALDYCRKEHTDLASILTEEDQTWAELEARKADTAYVWPALHYSCILEAWFWVGNDCFEFNRWSTDDKLDQCDVSAAMETKGNHLWFSKSDHNRFNFICQ